ncbi:acetyl-CoA carboxyl transferase [Planosporangium flavigriseum]|uniref:Acetyl-CoA carboxylase n=1 Tax=Planosporangium flavigriseum TaxID=373681 RepID=A0A8J3LSW1_9ACTN|nr:carboxyl transferase domain-containing protein [Planosporangium flavigriseum]NJC67757.1 acetyl-CoA carboxyl transferase [Planosporangium flavigriseum]GIG76033.1 acetyl-CoA carboxylase [Planosporangium flavigriseum]
MASEPGARAFIEQVLDSGSWVPWDDPEPTLADVPDDYRAALARARQETGLTEAVLTGEGRIAGRRVAVLAGDFGFLGGSIGVATAERLLLAMERATREALPLLVAPASGGTRMQEGTLAFLQMVKITDAVAAHRAAGLPYLVYLRHPTTGGVLASWGSLGHVTLAQPGALIGFLGPRAYEAIRGEAPPDGVQSAENLHKHGLIDAVVPAEELAETIERVLNVACAPHPVGVRPPAPYGSVPDVSAWESIQRTRRADRPGVRDLLRATALDVVHLHGSLEGDVDEGVVLALATFGGLPCVVVGHDRSGPALFRSALRVGRRGMRLARELRVPLLTVIDTPGAALSPEAEEEGVASAIAHSLLDLVRLDAPTVSVVLGQGAGGAALALLPADRVLCAQHGWVSPLPPEGASAIVHRTPDHAPEVAAAQGVRSLDLLRHGIVDRVVPELPDAAEEPESFLDRMGLAIEYELASVLVTDPVSRLTARRARYRNLGRETLTSDT